ncbi:hypothetical protein [Gimesia aquarii]|uniref:Uncharacterized protein n=1 Tax=Gimesia aquarii TaxID=2527964 RepID=A0A517X0N9_9PLAN|nr:hypothetical protein [Gimesia aquarii]QDU11073.1 hypothetical protein V202x_44890 [Gimesia aquarii]
MKKYKDDLFAIVAGGSFLYFSTLDKEWALFWKITGFLLLIWGILTVCIHLKSGKKP